MPQNNNTTKGFKGKHLSFAERHKPVEASGLGDAFPAGSSITEANRRLGYGGRSIDRKQCVHKSKGLLKKRTSLGQRPHDIRISVVIVVGAKLGSPNGYFVLIAASSSVLSSLSSSARSLKF